MRLDRGYAETNFTCNMNLRVDEISFGGYILGEE
jgi:hypothetical protein